MKLHNLMSVIASSNGRIWNTLLHWCFEVKYSVWSESKYQLCVL